MSRELLDTELLKHNAIIQSDNRSISYVDKKISNVLLVNAFDDLENKDIHRISFNKLSDEIGWGNDYNRSAIIESIRNLSNTEIRWNILGEDIKNDWTQSKLIASFRVIVNEGLIEYSYSPHLRNILRHPNIYSRINLLIQKSIHSKYCLNLWELLKTQIGDKGNHNRATETQYFDVQELKDILGVTGELYNEFKYFKNRILIHAINELNEKTNIFVIDVLYKKDKRTIVAISFKIQYKDSIQSELQLTEESRIFEYLKDNRYKILKEEFNSWNVSEAFILKQFEEYSYDQIIEIISSATNWIKNKGNKKLPQILTSAFNYHWRSPPATGSNSSNNYNKNNKKKSIPKVEKSISDDSDDNFNQIINDFNNLPEQIKQMIENDCKKTIIIFDKLGEIQRLSTMASHYADNINKYK